MESKVLTVVIALQLVALGACADQSPTEPWDPQIDPADFVSTIDNPYFPLEPGTTYSYSGETEDGRETGEVLVTSETRVVLGVTTLVVRDRVFLEGELIEETFDWYAQDSEGNVWYFGEDSKEFEGGELVSTEGSWEAGVDGAKPGIIMLADPTVGTEYRQEYAPGVAEDMGRVLGLDESADAPFGSFTGCLKTEDSTPLEPGVREHKFYCPDIGLVLEIDVTGGGARNELIDVQGP
ncbi:MAG: hypothetical protein JSV86_04820 [Gemmatimonadota bacterium]|nr:MAG: hypothetical protein JSV86_04820 [Gemmatimonadota bacterium]